jgi:predicted O-methyltransferase YrrM
MDIALYDTVEPQSHYEYYIDSKQTDVNSDVKQRAFAAMSLLEGWCSTQKAGILIDFILNTKPNTIVEIGVFGGKSLVPMAYALQQNQKGKIYGIDPWESAQSVVGMDGINKDYWSHVDHEAILQGLVQRIRQFNLEPYIQLIRMTSEAAPAISSIDVLHVDGNHADQTSYLDVTKWVPLVNKGGLVIFDDMTWGTNRRAVEWLDAHCTKLAEYHGDNVWGIWVKS